MCGIAGFFEKRGISYNPQEILHTMGEAISHRGPDDSGEWFDRNAGVGLSHRRLSILDLSQAGHQPMMSGSKRFVTVFNGEIYNHSDLRNEINNSNPGLFWRGHSDTETLLACFDVWGISETLSKSVGMFSIAVWDREKRVLYLARDRLGEKPLYYGWCNSSFLFGSELKALKSHPKFESKINRGALALFMRHNYIPDPYCIWEGIRKLSPGVILSLSIDDMNESCSLYWSVKDAVEHGVKNKVVFRPKEAVNKLEAILVESIGQKMIADVPLGAFLSGGVDSSTVVALMQSQSSKPVKTFSIGFNEDKYNEAIYAKAVAKHLGTEHTELYVTANDALSIIPNLSALYDEPFADSSQIPTYLVSRMAREHVNVSLTGDGGDELFCGYQRYLYANNLLATISGIPYPFRCLAENVIKRFSPEIWNDARDLISWCLPKCYQSTNIGDRLHKATDLLQEKELEGLYHKLVSHWRYPESLVLGSSEPPTVLTDELKRPKTEDPFEILMAIDLLSYLPGDILTKVDRAAMGVSLETRVPFLDHRVVEFACCLPQRYKIHNGLDKWILREVLYKYVPRSLIERPKMGFGMPVGEWLRGPLREWAENLLDRKRLVHEGYLDVEQVRIKWREHVHGGRNWQGHLWCILVFQDWLDKYES